MASIEDLNEERPPRSQRLRLGLLGGFVLSAPDGTPVELPTRKSELLLSYLAMPAGRPHSREKLAGLFWGSSGDEQARGSLRKALSALRLSLGAKALEIDRDSVALSPGALEIDTDELARLAADPDAVTAQPNTLRRGEFLDVRSTGGAEFDDWVSFERTRCRGLMQTVLERLALAHGEGGRINEAIAAARELLATDTLREASHRLLMRLHADSGERSQALAQFQVCRELLKRELGVEPSEETVLLSRAVASSAGAPEPTAAPPPTPPEGTTARRGLSVAVLPFAVEDSAADSFFASALSQDITTELSRQQEFLVIAPQSSFTYAGGAHDAPRAATELGVRYVLTGTLRRAGGQLRIAAQLLDAAAHRLVWAERYDRPVEDLFALQDAVVADIIAAVDAGMRAAERERAASKRPENLDAWELCYRGFWHAYKFTRDDHAEAEALFRRAIALDPSFALPVAGRAYLSLSSITFHFATKVGEALAEGIAIAERALALDAAEPFGHVALGRLLTLKGDFDRAERHLIRAIELSPSFAQAHFGLAQLFYWTSRLQDALTSVDRAERLNPRDPLGSQFRTLASFCHYWLGDFAAAETAARQACARLGHEAWSRLALAIALVERGATVEAAAAITDARQIDPTLSLSSFDAIVGRVPLEARSRAYAALAKAGLA